MEGSGWSKNIWILRNLDPQLCSYYSSLVSFCVIEERISKYASLFLCSPQIFRCMWFFFGVGGAALVFCIKLMGAHIVANLH
jgi:hypothetical protein